jgi:2'-5' RNA ligase
MRTFIAIEIPNEIKQQIAAAQAGFRNADIDASWPRPEGIHLTLKFLGEVPETQTSDIVRALQNSVRGMRPFRIEIGGAGAFPNARNARVLWIGVTGEMEELNRLQAGVEDAMARIGFDREDKPFKPHLTLARIKYIRSRDRWLAAMDQVKDIRLAGFEVESISLMKSELKRTGAKYAEIAKIELQQ